MTDPAVSELGLLGDTKAIELILAGNYQPPLHMDPYLKELLEAMRMPKYIRQYLAARGPLKTDILEAENKSAWKKCRMNAIDTLFCQLPYQHGFSPAL
jgi:hypothetical protein